jgi:hypothetical protein
MGYENTYRCTQNVEHGFGLDFLEQHHKYDHEFLNHIATGDDIWVSFVNVETKELSKQWMHTHSPNKHHLPES